MHRFSTILILFKLFVLNEVLFSPDSWSACTSLPSDLISWWSGNNHSFDLIGLNNGIRFHGTAYATSGKVSQAFAFDGNDDVVLIPPSALNEAYAQLTIDAWIFPLRHGNSGTEDLGLTIISKTEFDGFALRVYNGYLQADFRTSDGNFVVNFESQTLPLNTWSHVAVTYDGNWITGYYNGSILDSVPATGTITNIRNASACLMIGNEPEVNEETQECDVFHYIISVPEANFTWEGLIDEVHFFNRALSSGEIQAIFNADSNGLCLDLTPTAFAFTDLTGAELSILYTSNTITVGGLGYNAPISITGGQYRINTGSYTANTGTVTNGDSVTVQLTSSGSYSTAVNAVLTIGTGNDTYTVTTKNAFDTTPDAFSFTPQTNMALSTVIESNTIPVAGINTASPISIVGGQYSVNSGAYTAVAGNVNNGDIVRVRQMSSANFSTLTAATLTIGGVNGAFNVTTLAADTTPDAFSFTPQTDLALGTAVESNTITVSGINTASPISIVGGEYSVNGGAYTALAGTVNNGSTVQVRQTSSANFSTLTTATLTIGGVNGAFNVTTLAADTTPDAFSFTPQTNVALITVVESNTITVSGINTASPISVTAGGEYSVNGGAYTAAAGTVNNGDTVRVRQTSSSSVLTKTDVTLTIGGVASTFSVTSLGGKNVFLPLIKK
jgi:hypothetical protein